MNPIIPQIRRADPISLVGLPTERPRVASIDLQIDALVFHGFSRTDSHRASEAFQQELARLLATADLSAFSNASPEFGGCRPQTAGFLDGSNPLRGDDNACREPRDHMDAGTIRALGAHPECTGRHAAQALFGGLRS